MDDEDDMCILQSEHDLDECIKFTEHRKKESGNSGNNKSATNDPVVIGENNAQNNATAAATATTEARVISDRFRPEQTKRR